MAVSDSDHSLMTAAAFNAAAVDAETAGTPEDFLSAAVKRLVDLLELDGGAILLGENGSTRVAAHIGFPAAQLSVIERTGACDGCDANDCWTVPLTLPDGHELGVFVGHVRRSEPASEHTRQLAAAYGSVIA